MRIYKDIQELLKAGVIDEDTAEKIRSYYNKKEGYFQNRLLTIFSILGAILVGLGLILIIAHNWDEFSRTTRTILAFLPLIAGQGASFTVLIRKYNHAALRESVATFLYFSIGACIALISQIYHIPGSIGSFLLTWMPFSFPLIFIMRSSTVSLLYLIGITTYVIHTAYLDYPTSNAYLYWLLLLPVLVFYYWLYKSRPLSNFTIFHNWFIPLSLVFSLGSLAQVHEKLMYIAYFSLFALFYLIGKSDFFSQQKIRYNGYLAIGSLGTVYLLLATSFSGFWENLREETYALQSVLISPEIISSVLLTGLAALFFAYHWRNKSINAILPFGPVFILFITIFITGFLMPLSTALINILILIIAIVTIREGTKMNKLGVLNFGLLIIVALVLCRFLDTDLSFVLRGILFVLVGIGFFVANFLMLRKRKSYEQ